MRLDFGESMRQHRSAMQVALEAFPQTLKLASVAMLLSLSLAIVVGSLAAARPRGLFDRIATVISLAGASAPAFWVAIVAILVFAVGMGILPTSGTGGWEFWVMPIFVLMHRPFGLVANGKE